MVTMTSETQPWRITVYDRTGTRTGWVANPSQLSLTLALHATGTATFTVPATHPQTAALLEPGSRVLIEHDVAWDVPGPPDWRHALSGHVRSRQGQGPEAAATITVTVADDYRLLSRVLAWPDPTAPISAQTVEHDVLTGPAETVATTLVARNAIGRLGLPLTVDPSLERGATITVAARMSPLHDVLMPAVELAGIHLHVRQASNGRTADGLRLLVREPVVHPRPLTEASGAVRTWQYVLSAPTLTRVVVGGQGEGTARTFRALADPAAEGAWADLVEGFRDATDVTTTPLLDERGLLSLAEGAASSGLTLELADTPGLRPLRDLVVGDVVTIAVGGQLITDVLREMRITWTPDHGSVITPVVGGWSGSPQRDLINLVARIARAVTQLGRR